MINNPLVPGDPGMYDLKWIVEHLREHDARIENMTRDKLLKYADPFQWSIENAYQQNTVVIDPVSGNGYISLKPVPYGILLTNLDYWALIFDYNTLLTGFREAVAYDQGNRTHADKDFNIGDLLFMGGYLYRVKAVIAEDAELLPGTNIEFTDIEQELKRITGLMANNVLKGVPVLCIGDSYCWGQGATPEVGWWKHFGDITGAEVYKIRQSGAGIEPATNYNEHADFADMNLAQAYAAWCAANPSVVPRIRHVVIQCGRNDALRSNANSTYTATYNFINAIKAAMPYAQVHVVPMWAPDITSSYVLSPTSMGVLMAIARGAAAAGAHACTVSPSWFIKDTSVSGSGTGHYSTDGYKLMGGYIAAFVNGWDGHIIRSEDITLNSSALDLDNSFCSITNDAWDVHVWYQLKTKAGQAWPAGWELITLPEKYRPYAVETFACDITPDSGERAVGFMRADASGAVKVYAPYYNEAGNPAAPCQIRGVLSFKRALR